jgi:hypothetical protein
MAVVNKHAALRRHAVVDVACDHCGNSVRLPRVNDRMRDVLIQMGYYRGFLRELNLLERTERLFANFSDSRHQLIAEHLHLSPNDATTAADEAFERALGEDPELHQFLNRCGFLLPVRLTFVRESVTSYSKRVEEFRLPCTVALHREIVWGARGPVVLGVDLADKRSDLLAEGRLFDLDDSLVAGVAIVRRAYDLFRPGPLV